MSDLLSTSWTDPTIWEEKDTREKAVTEIVRAIRKLQLAEDMDTGVDGDFLEAPNNLGDVDNVAASQDNLGLGVNDDVEHNSLTVKPTSVGDDGLVIQVDPFDPFKRYLLTRFNSNALGLRYDTGIGSPSLALLIDVGSNEITFNYSTILSGSKCDVHANAEFNGTAQFDGATVFNWDVRFDWKVGFFGATPVFKNSVDNLTAINVTETADTSYDTNERDMLNNLKQDVVDLRSKLDELLDALQSYGLV